MYPFATPFSSHSGCWSSNIGLIPLTGPAARIFWRTLQGPEVKPVNLYFNVLTIDSRATTFQKMIKKKIVRDSYFILFIYINLSIRMQLWVFV